MYKYTHILYAYAFAIAYACAYAWNAIIKKTLYAWKYCDVAKLSDLQA